MTDSRESLLSEKAYQRIRRMIVTLELKPGSIVRESDLRNELDLGRTPIREAMLRLSLENLVTIIPRQGIIVTEIAITDLLHLFELRLSLETLAAQLAAQRGSKAHWDEMRAVLAPIMSDGKQASNRELIEVDERCHQIIYRASGNEFLARMASTLYASSLRLWYYFLADIGDMTEAVVEHSRILTALEEGDEQRAPELIEGHIRAFHREIQSAIGTTPGTAVGG